MTEQQIAEYVEQGKAFNPVRFQEQQMSGNVVVGDCLDILRTWVSDESIDLVYADPPFNSGVDYGKFNDVWYWDADAEESYQQMPNGKLLDAVNAVRLVSGPDSPMAAYALFMGRRLAELHRVLKPTGSIYLHCDPKANWCLRILLDATFGRQQFRNEIVWAYTGPSSPGARQFNRKHDTLLWYAKGKQWIFNTDAVRIPHKALNTNRAGRVIADAMTEELRDKYLKQGKVPETWWPDFSPVGRLKNERTGYPTQKPLALLERIIKASSNEGDIVLDPFCGSGTTLVAARNLSRSWAGIDISQDAVNIAFNRLSESSAEMILKQ